MSGHAPRDWSWVWAIFIAVAGAVSFVGKAVHVDDPNYLGVARKILDRPLDPYSGPSVWFPGDGLLDNANPPLWSYLYAAAASIVGWNEFVFHLIEAAAYIAFVCGMLRLCRRVTTRPLLWTSAIAFSPLILPGQNLMLDIPMLAFWVWSLECQFQAWETDRISWSSAAGTLAGCAALVKYTGLLLIPLLAVGAAAYRRPRGLWALAPAVGLLALWCGHNLIYYGRPHLLMHGGGVFADSVLDRMRVFLRGAGSMIVVTPLWLRASWTRGARARWTCLAIVVVSAGWGALDQKWSVAQISDSGMAVPAAVQTHFVLFAANGAATALLATLLLRGRSIGWATQIEGAARARTVLMAWAALALVYYLFLVPAASFGAVRHLAVGLIPVIIVAGGRIDAWSTNRTRRWASTAFVFASSMLGFGLADADYRIADVYRQAAREHIEPLAQQRTVWFSGDPSFRYYAEAAGGHRLIMDDPAATNQVRPGDVLVIPFLQGTGVLQSGALERFRLSARLPVASRNPLRTIATITNYYGGNTMTLPWQCLPSLNETPLDDILIFTCVSE